MDAQSYSGAPARSTIADRVAGALVPGLRKLDRFPTAAGLLRGEWLGHPLHPALTDLPIGFWTSAWVLDLTPGGRDAARRLIGLGVISALPTAAAGLADWPQISRRKDRTALAHMSCNLAATALYAMSWRARHRRQEFRGFVLAQLGAAAATAGGALGGVLVFGNDRPSSVITDDLGHQ